MSEASTLRGFALREVVALHLRAAGADVTARPRDVGSISQRLAAMAETGPVGDLQGPDVDGFHVHVRADVREHWSRALDRVEAVAGDGELPVLIEPRAYRTTGDAWVMMSLPTFARLLRERQR